MPGVQVLERLGWWRPSWIYDASGLSAGVLQHLVLEADQDPGLIPIPSFSAPGFPEVPVF